MVSPRVNRALGGLGVGTGCAPRSARFRKKHSMPISRSMNGALVAVALSGLLGGASVGAQTPASASAQEKANLANFDDLDFKRLQRPEVG